MDKKINRPIEVVIADKSPLVLAGLVAIFGDSPDFQVVATAADGERFMEAVNTLTFDIGVIGWKMPYMDGQQVLRAVRDRDYAPRIVIYTGDRNVAVPRQVMMEGGAGFCSKEEDPAQLVETVRAVAAGRMIFPFMDLRGPMQDPLAALTARERELLMALAEGKTNAQIAHGMEISLNTVKFHLKNLYEKLSVRNRAQAVAVYLKGASPEE